MFAEYDTASDAEEDHEVTVTDIPREPFENADEMYNDHEEGSDEEVHHHTSEYVHQAPVMPPHTHFSSTVESGGQRASSVHQHHPPPPPDRNLNDEFDLAARDDTERIEQLRKRLQRFGGLGGGGLAPQSVQPPQQPSWATQPIPGLATTYEVHPTTTTSATTNPQPQAPPSTQQKEPKEAQMDTGRAREVYLNSLSSQREMIHQWQDLLRQMHNVEIAEKAKVLQKQRDAVRDEERLLEVRKRELEVLMSGLQQRDRDLNREAEKVTNQLREPSFKEQEARLEERAKSIEARMEEMQRLYQTIEERRNRMRHREMDLDTRERQISLKEAEWARRVREIERHLGDRTSEIERREAQVTSWLRTLEVRERDILRRETTLRQAQSDLMKKETQQRTSSNNVYTAGSDGRTTQKTEMEKAEEIFAFLEKLQSKSKVVRSYELDCDEESIDRSDDEQGVTEGSSPQEAYGQQQTHANTASHAMGSAGSSDSYSDDEEGEDDDHLHSTHVKFHLENQHQDILSFI